MGTADVRGETAKGESESTEWGRFVVYGMWTSLEDVHRTVGLMPSQQMGHKRDACAITGQNAPSRV